MGLALCHLLSLVHPILWCSPLHFKRSLFLAYFAAFYIVSLQSANNFVTVLLLSGYLPYSFWCYWQFRKKLHVFAFFFRYVSCLATNLSLHHCVPKVDVPYFLLHFILFYGVPSDLLFPSWFSSSFWFFSTSQFQVQNYFWYSFFKCLHANLCIYLLIGLPRHLYLNSVLFLWLFCMFKYI